MLDVSVTIMNLRATFSTLNISADFSIFSVSCNRIPQDTTDITISLGTFGVLKLLLIEKGELKGVHHNNKNDVILTPYVRLFVSCGNY